MATIPGGISISSDWRSLGDSRIKDLRFRAGPNTASSSEVANEVVSFLWIGGEFVDSVLADSAMGSAFASLGWPAGPRARRRS